MPLVEPDAEIVASCFPSALLTDVAVVTAILPTNRLSPVLDIRVKAAGPMVVRVVVDGVSLNVLGRVYNSEPDPGLTASMSRPRRLICDCIYSRHHDGFVRERHVEPLLVCDEPWVVTFVLQLLGEYVIEIARLIKDHIDEVSPEVFHRYAAANPDFISRTCRRIVSYYGHDLAASPSYAVMNQLGVWDRRQASRLLRT